MERSDLLEKGCDDELQVNFWDIRILETRSSEIGFLCGSVKRERDERKTMTGEEAHDIRDSCSFAYIVF
jgi:hypothetical protein